jgi:hypothetical protein
MSASKEEIKLKLIEHIGELLNFFYIEDGMSEDEIEDTSIQSATLAGIIVDSLGAEIKEIFSENEFALRLKLNDVESFIQAILSKNLVDD